MNVYAIGDLHLSINNPKPMDIFGPVWDGYVDKLVEYWQQNIGSGDVILIPGDISWAMTLESARADLEFIGELPGRKVLLRGNHDYWWKSITAVRGALPKDIYAIQNDCIRIEDLLICGTRGWSVPERLSEQSPEDKKIFDREVIRLEMSLAAMAKERRAGDSIIAMMHFPPFNSRFEASAFTKRFDEANVGRIVYGHLHGKNSRYKDAVNVGGSDYYLTSCDFLQNKPVKIVF